MTKYTQRVLIVVRAPDGATANEAAKKFDPMGGRLTFTVGLSPTGENPPTHYWCSGQLRPETWQTVQGMKGGFVGSTFLAFDPESEKGKPDVVLAQLGLKRIG